MDLLQLQPLLETTVGPGESVSPPNVPVSRIEIISTPDDPTSPVTIEDVTVDACVYLRK